MLNLIISEISPYIASHPLGTAVEGIWITVRPIPRPRQLQVGRCQPHGKPPAWEVQQTSIGADTCQANPRHLRWFVSPVNGPGLRRPIGSTPTRHQQGE